jgi:hypothetical protein
LHLSGPTITVSDDLSHSTTPSSNLFVMPNHDTSDGNYTFGVLAANQLNRNYIDAGAGAFDYVDSGVSNSIIVCGISQIRVDRPTAPGVYYPITYQASTNSW